MEILTLLSLAVGTLVSLTGLLGVLFKYFIVKPLQDSIDHLAESVKTIMQEIKISQNDRRELSERIVSLETHVKNLWKNIGEQKEGHSHE